MGRFSLPRTRESDELNVIGGGPAIGNTRVPNDLDQCGEFTSQPRLLWSVEVLAHPILGDGEEIDFEAGPFFLAVGKDADIVLQLQSRSGS